MEVTYWPRSCLLLISSYHKLLKFARAVHRSQRKTLCIVFHVADFRRSLNGCNCGRTGIFLLALRLHLHAASPTETICSAILCLENPMSPRSRFALSLAVVLSLSTLALADSIPAASMLRSSAIVALGHFAPDTAKPAPTAVFAFERSSSVSPNFTFMDERHGTIARRDGEWRPWHANPVAPLATPEPGSLMLLSTGLVGIGGLIRRKLPRA